MDKEISGRVAKALYDSFCLANPHVNVEWEGLPWDLKSFYENLALDAIKAMREPTEKMLDNMNFVHRHEALVFWYTIVDGITND